MYNSSTRATPISIASFWLRYFSLQSFPSVHFTQNVTHSPRRIALKWTKSLNGAKMHPLKLTYNFKLVFLLGPSYKYLLDDLWWENRTASSVRGEPIPAKTWLRHSFSFWGSQKPRVFHINKRTILAKTNLDEQQRREARYSYFEKGCRKKCTRQSRKVLWVVLSSLFYKEIWKKGTRGHGHMFARAKGKQKK